VGAAIAVPAKAQFFPISSPVTAYTTQTTLVPIADPNFSVVPSISASGQTFTFATGLTAFTVGPGGWSAWGSPPDTEGSTPRVLASDINQTALTFTLSTPANTVGFEIEPANRGAAPPAAPTPFTISATFFNGGTVLGTVSRAIPNNGALLEAASSTTPITSIQISSPFAAGGFALAQFRFGNVIIGAPPPTAPASVPTLGTTALAGLALLLAAAALLLAPVRT
jgi:hypothetical protein